MNQYISYHKKPYSTFMSVEDYNAKFGTSIEADEEYEMYFKLHYEKARKESGPDEFITVKFYDMAERKSWSKWFSDKAEGAYKWGKKKMTGKKPPKKEVEKVVEEQVNLDDVLSDEDDMEEAVAEAVPEVEEKAAVEEKPEADKIKEIVAEAASDASALAQDLKHLIQFKSANVELRDQLLKGRPRYLQAIKDYVKGDKDATIRMSFRSGKKTVKISSLNPKMESLKALLKASSGQPRVVECL